MAESSEDIESGSHRLKSALSGEIGSINRPFKVFLDAFQFGFKLAYRPMKFAKSGSHRLNSALRSKKEASPDKILRNIAFILAVIEKAASTLGTMNFIWATVVLLGGFSQSLKSIDFWFVNVILVVEGLRILCRQGELKTQAMTWRSSSPDFMLELIHQYSLAIQEYSAIACIVLSSLRIHKQQYGGDDNRNRNRNRALNLFYWLSLVESSLTLFGFVVRLILSNPSIPRFPTGSDELMRENGFGQSLNYSALKEVGFGYSKRFLYYTYCRCMNGSVFDGLKMDFVTYSAELVQADGGHGQRTGTRILCALVNSDRFAQETLRAIGTMSEVVERLIEMLNWSNHHEQEIRRAAAEIITKLVRTNRNCIRVAAIAGSMESIASLLYDSKQIEVHCRDFAKTRNLHRQYGDPCSSEYEYSVFSLLGLRILKNLAKDHVNCSRIGSSKDLLPKIIGLTEINPNTCKSEIKTVKLAVHLVRMLASSTGFTGKILRKEICEIVFAISNLRDILHYREISTNGLQILAIDTLTSLALDDAGRESIGSTGGVLRDLFSMFFMERSVISEGQYVATMTKLVGKAGEALALLSLESKHNCRRIISLKLQGRTKYDSNIIVKLISVLEDELQGIHAARILRSLCSYSETDYAELREVTAVAAQVVKSSIEKRGAHQEAAIGLAAQIIKLMSKSDFDRVFKEWRAVTNRSLVSELVEVFRRHPRPSKEFPSIRRFSIELLIGVMQMDRAAIVMRSELEVVLKGVLETRSELESYSTFSGSMGLSRHRLPIQSLVESAMELLHD